jgi:5-methylcytosine-specific restriction endonuclease McrA
VSEPALQITMRAPCKCGSEAGRIEPKQGQNLVYCLGCGGWQYNAPKSETGEAQRSVRSRPDMKPGQKSRILERDSNRCLMCGRLGGPLEDGAVILHVGHILSVDEGPAAGASDAEIWDDSNLFAQCEECNLGQGARSLAPRQAMLLVRAAVQRAERALAKVDAPRKVKERNYDK